MIPVCRIKLFLFLLVFISCGNKFPERPPIQFTFESKTTEQILMGEVLWSKVHEMKYHFGYWKPSVWVKFDLVNPEESTKDYILELESPWVDSVLLVWKENGKVIEKRFDGSAAFSSRELQHRNPTYQLALEPLETRTIYAHIKTQGYSMHHFVFGR